MGKVEMEKKEKGELLSSIKNKVHTNIKFGEGKRGETGWGKSGLRIPKGVYPIRP